MNQINAQPGEISVIIKVENPTHKINFNLMIDPQAPFNVFQQFVKDQIFAEVAQKTFDNLVYSFRNEILGETEAKTLSELGFKTDSELVVHLRVKGGGY